MYKNRRYSCAVPNELQRTAQEVILKLFQNPHNNFSRMERSSFAVLGKVFLTFMFSGICDGAYTKERDFIYVTNMSNTGSFHIYTEGSISLIDAVSLFIHNKLFSGDHGTKIYVVVFQPEVKVGQYPFCHIMIHDPIRFICIIAKSLVLFRRIVKNLIYLLQILNFHVQ